MFAVVLFTESDNIAVVPMTWVNSKKTECWWPPLKGGNLGRAVERSMVPDKATWMSYDIHVLKETGMITYACLVKIRDIFMLPILTGAYVYNPCYL